MNTVSEFPAFERVARVVDPLDAHRQRQVFAFIAERYGWNVQPTARKILPAMNPENRSEFAAIETITDELDPLTKEQQGQAIALLAARYGAKVIASYKPPARGFSPQRKFGKS